MGISDEVEPRLSYMSKRRAFGAVGSMKSEHCARGFMRRMCMAVRDVAIPKRVRKGGKIACRGQAHLHFLE